MPSFCRFMLLLLLLRRLPPLPYFRHDIDVADVLPVAVSRYDKALVTSAMMRVMPARAAAALAVMLRAAVCYAARYMMP